MVNTCTPLHEAQEQLQQWRIQNKRIVFTNGCFDILHPGHIDYLQQAKALGDILVIALNDDASIHRLKGSSRPVNPLRNRCIMLAALKAVDMVISFSEDTPLKLIQSLQPDVLVKGGDYEPDEIIGSEEVRKNGGKVIVIPFVDGHSTSALIARIKTAH